MTDAEWDKRRKMFREDIDGLVYRMTGQKAHDEMMAALDAIAKAKSFAEKVSREKRLSALIDRQIRADHEAEVAKVAAAHEAEVQRIAWERMLEAEDEEIALNFLIH